MEQCFPKRRHKIVYEDGTGRVFRNVGTKLFVKMEQAEFFEMSAQNYLLGWNSVPKRKHIIFSRRGVTQKKECNKKSHISK
jgi:hypothetical protein